MKGLAGTGEKRFSGLPNVPTAIESGLKDYHVTSWNGLGQPGYANAANGAGHIPAVLKLVSVPAGFDVQIGDVILMRAYRQVGPTGSAFCPPMPKTWTKGELLYQIRNFHAFLWASGGAFSDFLIHNIDECCWIKNDWPIEAQASGGRHFRGE